MRRASPHPHLLFRRLNILHNVDSAILGVKVTRAYNVLAADCFQMRNSRNRFLEGRENMMRRRSASVATAALLLACQQARAKSPRRTGGRRRAGGPAHQIRESASRRSRADRADHLAHHAASADALSGRDGAARRASERSRLRQSDIHRQFGYSPKLPGWRLRDAGQEISGLDSLLQRDALSRARSWQERSRQPRHGDQAHRRRGRHAC